MPAIKHMLTIKSPAEKVYRAATSKEGLASWWTDNVIAEEKLHAVLEFRFGGTYHNKMEVIELVQNRIVEWKCIAGDKEWLGTRLLFDIRESEAGTVLRFSQLDWREETDFFASCNYQWGIYMKSLKDYCEKGKGNPFKEQ
jgi:uncharacterized protein YndB with AHSA1/START domain